MGFTYESNLKKKKNQFPHFSDVLPFSLGSFMQFHKFVVPGLGINHTHLTDSMPIMLFIPRFTR